MDKRVQLDAVILINWENFPYQRFETDEDVTGVEGNNGSGKTTLLEAAQLVLMPDFSKLRFSNVGEGQSSGKEGLLEKLGNPDALTYAIHEVSWPGKTRFFMGVAIKQKGYGSLEVKTFTIDGMPLGTPAEEFLMGPGDGDERVFLDLLDLKDSVAEHGALLTDYATYNDYFGYLFDVGVIPLRLNREDERSRLASLMRANMMGGISNNLTSGLKEFLFLPEPNAGANHRDILENMKAASQTRAVLSANKAIRDFVVKVHSRARRLAVMVCSIAGSRLARTEEERGSARAEVSTLKSEVDLLSGDVAKAQAELERIGSTESETKGKLKQAKKQLDNTKEAFNTQSDLREKRREHEDIKKEMSGYSERQHYLFERKPIAQRTFDEADKAATQARTALMDQQKTFMFLNKNVAAYRRVAASLESLQKTYPERNITRDNVLELSSQLEAEKKTLKSKRDGSKERLDEDSEKKKLIGKALQSLARILGRPAGEDDVSQAFIEAEEKVQLMRTGIDQRAVLEAELEKTKKNATEQSRARALAESIAGRPTSVAQVKALIDDRSEKRVAAEDEARLVGKRLIQQKAMTEAHDRRVSLLRQEIPEWENVLKRANALEKRASVSVKDERGIGSILSETRRKQQNLRKEILTVEAQLQSAAGKLEALRQAHGNVPLEVSLFAQQVGGRPMPDYFEDCSPEEAGKLQALLGSLSDAVVVSSLDALSEHRHLLSASTRELNFIELPEGGSIETLIPSGSESQGFVEVRCGNQLRWTKVPEAPYFGKKAREKRLSELMEEESRLRVLLQQQTGELSELEAIENELTYLARQSHWLLKPDLFAELAKGNDLLKGSMEEESRLGEALEKAEGQKEEANLTLRKLMELAPISSLLEEEDLSEKAVRLKNALTRLDHDERFLRSVASDNAFLSTHKKTLLSPLLSRDARLAEEALSERLKASLESTKNLLNAIEDVAENFEAFQYERLVEVLNDNERLVDSFKVNLEISEAKRKEALSELDSINSESTVCKDRIDDAERRLKALSQKINESLTKLSSLGFSEDDGIDINAANNAVETIEVSLEEMADKKKSCLEAVTDLLGTLKTKGKAHETAQAKLQGIETQFKRLQDDWDELWAILSRENLPADFFHSMEARELEKAAPDKVYTEALLIYSELQPLVEENHEVTQALNRAKEAGFDSAMFDILDLWVKVRRWLLEKIPSDQLSSDDPIEALNAWDKTLDRLAENLKNKENRLKTSGGEIAKRIMRKKRGARNKAAEFNVHLEKACFSTIRGIRLVVHDNPSMTGVLESLDQIGEMDLFRTSMTIEQLFQDVFRKAGGKDPECLLDYREYILPTIEIRREGGRGWVKLGTNIMSTGESMCVGFAIRALILGAWEEDSRRALGKHAKFRSLRLACADEINRLDELNTPIMFEMTKSLGLQLIAASPQVNSPLLNTTYRLCPKGADGRPGKVLRTGRRALATEESGMEENGDDGLAEALQPAGAFGALQFGLSQASAEPEGVL
jgi:chromosome partition protein MukB